MRPGPMDELTTQDQVGRRPAELSDVAVLLTLGGLAGPEAPAG